MTLVPLTLLFFQSSFHPPIVDNAFAKDFQDINTLLETPADHFIKTFALSHFLETPALNSHFIRKNMPSPAK